jgi:hypothetical protein
MRDVILFAFVAGLHFITSVCLLVYTFSAGMARFDSGVPAGLAETLAGWLLALLSVPLLTLLERLSALRFPGLLGYIPFAVNASLWGIVAVVARRCWRNQPSRRGQGGANQALQPTSGAGCTTLSTAPERKLLSGTWRLRRNWSKF